MGVQRQGLSYHCVGRGVIVFATVLVLALFASPNDKLFAAYALSLVSTVRTSRNKLSYRMTAAKTVTSDANDLCLFTLASFLTKD